MPGGGSDFLSLLLLTFDIFVFYQQPTAISLDTVAYRYNLFSVSCLALCTAHKQNHTVQYNTEYTLSAFQFCFSLQPTLKTKCFQHFLASYILSVIITFICKFKESAYKGPTPIQTKYVKISVFVTFFILIFALPYIFISYYHQLL